MSDESEVDDPTLPQSSVEDSEQLCRSAALLLLTAKERFQLTQSALNFITQQIQQMISYAVDDIDIEEAVVKFLADIPDLDACLEAMRNPFMSLSTEYLQTKFYREKFNLMVSMCNLFLSCIFTLIY